MWSQVVHGARLGFAVSGLGMIILPITSIHSVMSISLMYGPELIKLSMNQKPCSNH